MTDSLRDRLVHCGPDSEQDRGDILLSLLGLVKEDVGTYRACWIEPDRIVIRCMHDRWHYLSWGPVADESCGCPACRTNHKLPDHPLYRGARDLGRVEYLFAFPPEMVGELRALSLSIDPAEVWGERMDAAR
jgi:hypothetical protein